MNATENTSEFLRLQKAISRRLGLELNNLIFEYQLTGETYKLNLVTVNPRHAHSFLFHTSTGSSKQEALQHMLDYVSLSHRQENSYTVQWSKAGTSELHTSYFRGTNIHEVLKKFSHSCEPEQYVIYAITMNPVA